MWLGDWNVRLGCPLTPEKQEVLGPCGEMCLRTEHENRVMELLLEFDMVFLHGRTKLDGELFYSFYNGSNYSRRSIPDGMFVSRTLFKKRLKRRNCASLPHGEGMALPNDYQQEIVPTEKGGVPPKTTPSLT